MHSVETVVTRKLGFLQRYLRDLSDYANLNDDQRLDQHYAIERLLQLLCESAADIGLQRLKSVGETLPTSYRETFIALERLHLLESELAAELIKACGMRNLLTHVYDDLDLDQIMGAIEPALSLYGRYAQWVVAWIDQMHSGSSETSTKPREH